MRSLIIALLLLPLCGCKFLDGLHQFESGKHSTYPAPIAEEPINAKYQHVSDSAPDSLKPFYDPGLTQALNEARP